MLVWLALVMAPSGYLAQLDVIPSPNKTIKLVDKIRRQLMEDNYDYQPSDDDAATTGHDHTTSPDGARQTTIDVFKQATDSLDIEDRRNYNVSRKDLLYYMNVDGMRRNMDGNDISSALSGEIDDAYTSENTTTPKVKYKVIKIKETDPSRRKMTYQRYIQEESEAGVSIIRLDAAPFPQFHLPSARRQYMEEHSLDPGDDNATLVMETSS